MPRDIAEISIGRQHRQVMAEAKLRQQRIDGADLNAATPALVSQLGRVHVIAPVRHQERQCPKPIEELATVSRAGKPLQQLLQNEPRGHQLFARFDGADQLTTFDRRGGCVAPERQGPNAGIDKEAQRRDRSAL